MTQTELITELTRRLNQAPANRFQFELFEDGIRHDQEWWYVPVVSGVPEVNAFEYSPELQKIEEEFDRRGTKLLLIPALTE